MAHVLGCRQAVRREALTLKCAGSNPASPAKNMHKKTVRANALAVFFLPSRLDALSHKQRYKWHMFNLKCF